jgi:protein-S-isoprenylcysteine O-methyltransferase Ste14
MNLLPQLSIGWENAFWFSLLFWISNLIILKMYPDHYKDRVLKFPKLSGKSQEIIGRFNFILFQGLVFIVLFIPLQFETTWFIIGLILFTLSYTAYMMSLINYATSNPKYPVTKGIYRLSRNPQQISTIFMWIGIGFMCNCMLLILVCLFQFLTVYPTFRAQEEDCIRIYGESYRDYMQKVRRYF